MHFKSLLAGILLGAALAVAGMYFFGNDIRGSFATGTKEIGQSVQKAGQAIEKQGTKLH